MVMIVWVWLCDHDSVGVTVIMIVWVWLCDHDSVGVALCGDE